MLTQCLSDLDETGKAMVLGLARRYSHSAVEMFDLQDVETLIELVVRSVVRVTDKAQLLRI